MSPCINNMHKLFSALFKPCCRPIYIKSVYAISSGGMIRNSPKEIILKWLANICLFGQRLAPFQQYYRNATEAIINIRMLFNQSCTRKNQNAKMSPFYRIYLSKYTKKIGKLCQYTPLPLLVVESGIIIGNGKYRKIPVVVQQKSSKLLKKA